MSPVALRKESVDRNWQSIETPDSVSMSLSARRAWIEIYSLYGAARKNLVALRKESVDRNDGLPEIDTLKLGRSPQGERG